jgi:hypothetical protein
MRFRRFAAFAVLCAVVLGPAAALAQQDAEWSAVAALPLGTRVAIDTDSGQHATGTLASTSPDAVAINAAGTRHEFPRSTVTHVYRRPSRRAFATRGLLVGAGTGALAGAVLAESNRGRWSAFQAAGWGALGALIGLVEGLTADDQLVYRAPDAR